MGGHDAPVCGSRHLGFANALVHEMPHTLAALECGVLSEWRATLIVRESACLSLEHRRRLDAELCADLSRLVGWGNTRVEAEAKKIAARLDAAAVVERAATAAADRRVWIRPAPDTMTYLTVLLPVAQGVAVYANHRAQRAGRMRSLQLRQQTPGWTVTTTDYDGSHTAQFSTPTDATYQSTALPLPGAWPKRVSLMEGRLSIDLITFDAA